MIFSGNMLCLFFPCQAGCVLFLQGVVFFFFLQDPLFLYLARVLCFSCQGIVSFFLSKGLCLFYCQGVVFLEVGIFSSCVGLCFLIVERDCVFCLLQGLVFFFPLARGSVFFFQGVEIFLHMELCFAFFASGVFSFIPRGCAYFSSKGLCFFFSLQGLCFFSFARVMFFLSKGSCVFFF